MGKKINRTLNFFGLGKRASFSQANESLWTGVTGSASNSGVNVTDQKALQTSTVFACIRVLAESIASLPLIVYERQEDGGKKPASNHYLYKILHDSPNNYQTAFEFFELLMTHEGLRGNFYALKETNGAGKITQLLPLDPSRVEKKITDDDMIFYEYKKKDGGTAIFSFSEIWHVPALSVDGLIGLSPITVARESIGLALATEEHGARLFSNDARPGGMLEHPGKLSPDASKRLKESWTAAQSGGKNAHKVAVLEEGLKWTSVGFSNDDAQFLETRNFQVEDIARFYRVPSVMIGHPDKTMTYASAEQFFLSFVTYTIRPWAVRIEKSINNYLLTDRESKKFFVEFKLDGLLRGDTKSRYEAYAIAKQNKWMNSNEIRALENLNPIDGGDVFENPNITIEDKKPKETVSDEEEK